MTSKNKHAGFSTIEVLIVIVVLLLIGFVGYKVMDGQKEKEPTSTQQETHAISNKDDLDAAVDELKKVDTNTEQDEASLSQLVQ